MAGSASRISAMTVKLLADCDRPPNIRFERRNAGWRRGMEAENAFHDPDTANYRRGGCAVCGYLEDAGLRHDSAADRIFGEHDPAHSYSTDAGDAVVFCQPFIEEREVRVNDGARRQITVEHFLNEKTGFFHGGQLQWVVEFVVVVKGAGRRAV